ncbi:MAG: isoprenylcysteine carboxylmethyltransferase family protein [Myxococcota bacterium]
MSWRDPYRRGVLGLASHAILLCVVTGLDFSPVALVLIGLTSAHAGLEAAWSDDDSQRSAGYEAATGLLLFAMTVMAARQAVKLTATLTTGWGLFAVAIGSGLRLAAIRCLRDRFVTHTRDRFGVLDRHGIYALVRHPSELGLFLYAFGLAVISGAVLAWLTLAAGAGLGWSRIRREEQELNSLYGPLYLEYSKQTPAVIPNVARWLNLTLR